MSPEPRPCSAETGYGSPSPRFHSAVGLGLGALVVDLVGGQDHRLARLAQDPHDGLVGVGDAHGGVDDEEHRVGDVTAISACAAIRSARPRASGSQPPVSTTVKARPFQVAS